MGYSKKDTIITETILKNPEKFKSSGIKRLMEDALWTQGLRKKSNLKRNRYEFQTDHGIEKMV